LSSRINPQTAANLQQKLRTWIEKQGLTASDETEVAGYDAPWTPGPFRRNEVLIQLLDKSDTSSSDAN